MRRLLRFSAAAGGGVFLVSVIGLGPAGALALALLVVGLGWLLFAAAQLGPELRQAAAFAATVTVGALRLRVARRETAAGAGTNDQLESERFAVLREGGRPARLLRLSGPPSHVERCRSFVLLGHRLGGYKSRALEGRRLSTGEVIDFALWRRITDDLVRAGLMTKDRKNGARLRGELRDVLARLEGAELPSAPVRGEVITDSADGWQGA